MPKTVILGTARTPIGKLGGGNEGGKIAEGLYAVGWARRGPSGTIGTNRPDGFEVAENTGAGYTLRRQSDSYVLPAEFVPTEVRRQTNRNAEYGNRRPGH